MDGRPAPGERDSLALAFVNTRTSHGDDLAGWLDARGAEHGAVEDAAALREAVRELLEARADGRVPAGEAVAAVNAACAAAPAALALRWETGAAPQVGVVRSSDPVASLHAAVAADAISLVTDERGDDLRACAAPDCSRLLLRDRTRRRWCSTACGDRVRARRYYERHKAQPKP